VSARDRAMGPIAAVVALLLVVGASARRPLDGGAAVPALPAWPLLVVAGVGIVMGGSVTASVFRTRTRLRGGPPQGERRLAIRPGPLTMALALLVPLVVVAAYSSPGTSGRHPTAAPPPQFATHAPRQPKPERPGKDAGNGAAALAAGIAAGALGLTAVAVARWRRRARADEVEPRAAVAAGAREASAAAAIPADPRAAVLAAYARMEAALAGVGLARRASEAPREYLSRLDAALGGGRAPAARLTQLFERARFSVHPVDEGLRREAIGALDALRAELEEPA
jgi:Domain of unknown function (DUF4129)